MSNTGPVAYTVEGQTVDALRHERDAAQAEAAHCRAVLADFMRDKHPDWLADAVQQLGPDVAVLIFAALTGGAAFYAWTEIRRLQHHHAAQGERTMANHTKRKDWHRRAIAAAARYLEAQVKLHDAERQALSAEQELTESGLSRYADLATIVNGPSVYGDPDGGGGYACEGVPGIFVCQNTVILPRAVADDVVIQCDRCKAEAKKSTPHDGGLALASEQKISATEKRGEDFPF